MDERDIRGRFEKGHRGGPGRPRRRSEEQYLQATISKVTLADWKEIVEKAVTQAKRGDHRARQWLSDYVLGKPVQRSEVSGPEGDPIRIILDA